MAQSRGRYKKVTVKGSAARTSSSKANRAVKASTSGRYSRVAAAGTASGRPMSVIIHLGSGRTVKTLDLPSALGHSVIENAVREVAKSHKAQ